MLITRENIDEFEWMWPHFGLDEFVCGCRRIREAGLDGCTLVQVRQSLLTALEAIRSQLGNRPIRVTSGYRCPRYNALIGGVPNSQHILGNAADIQIQGIAPLQVADVAEPIIADKGGIGRYPTFTHIDVRGYRARW